MKSFTLLFQTLLAATLLGFVLADLKACPPRPSEDFSAVLNHYAVVLLRTLEVAIRGFLLGFGVSILKDLLLDGKRDDNNNASFLFKHASTVGLGMAATLVGASVVVPARLQQWIMET